MMGLEYGFWILILKGVAFTSPPTSKKMRNKSKRKIPRAISQMIMGKRGRKHKLRDIRISDSFCK
jgi:hypothetical protein